MNGTWVPGSSGQMAPRGPQLVVSCIEMEMEVFGGFAAQRRDIELASSG